MKVIITGNPRSGTSFVCQLISAMGLCPGLPVHLKRPDRYNPDGYWEHTLLASMTGRVFSILGFDFFYKLDPLTDGWHQSFNDEKERILDITSKENVEVYKDNKLLIIADLYDDLFPDAKWIYVLRDFNECYRSRWGEPISRKDYISLCQLRQRLWSQTKAANKSLTVDYKDFAGDLDGTIKRIAKYIEVDVSSKLLALRQLFKPGRVSRQKEI